MAVNVDKDIIDKVDDNLGGLVKTNFCCYPCYQESGNGLVSTECGPGGFNPEDYYTDSSNTNVPTSKVGGDYYYDDNGTTSLCNMLSVGCKRHVKGCTNPEASNYNENATKDDGSCLSYYVSDPIKLVCADTNATNYEEPDNKTTIPCPNNNCCQYESQETDPVDCGCDRKKLTLEREINTIDYEIEVLTRQKDNIIQNNQNSFVPNTNSGYDSYTPYSNIKADIQVANTNDIFEDCINNGVYRKYTATDITGVAETDFDSLAGNPDLSDSTKWIPIVDSNGVISFVLNDVYNDGNDSLVLSHNTQENSGANLYKEFCNSKGYVFDTFYTDTETGKQIQFTPNIDNTYQPKGIVTQKCVDASYIVCDDVADIKMVFGSNQWNGFNIPEDDGNTDIEISMDIMVRFNADTLLNDCLESNCGVPFIDVNSIFDSGCQNYIVFTDDSTTYNKLRDSKINSFVVEGETSQGKWVYNSESISLWQTPGIQNEPSTECCEAFGGEVVGSQTYLDNGETIQFSDLTIDAGSKVASAKNKLNELNSSYQTLLTEVNDCGVTFEEYTYKGCESNYSQLITTENLCSIKAPDECLAYTTLLQDYEVMINQLDIVEFELDLCVNEYYKIEEQIKDLDSEIKDIEVTIEEGKIEYNKFDTEQKEESKGFQEEISLFKGDIVNKENQIEIINNDIVSLQEKKESAVSNDEIFRLNKEISELDQKSQTTKNGISELNREIEDKTNEYTQNSKYNNKTLENIESNITQNEGCLEELYKLREELTKLSLSKICCLELQEKNAKFISELLGNVKEVRKLTENCYDTWKKTLQETYNRWQETQSGNVLQYMENTSIDVTLEVDNSLGTLQNNRVNKYKTLDSFTTDINPVWEFNPNGGYSGVLLEGSVASINVVKSSVNSELISRGQTPNNEIFDEQWQRVRFVLNDTQCQTLRQLYPNKEFFIGLSVKNERNCETTLLVDNLQINTDVNFLQKLYSTDNCISFDLSCVIDDRKSWIFTDGLVKTTYENKDVRCNPLPTDKKTLTFPKPQERYWDNLEYRYTDYSVNHSKLVLNSKSTTFRIDPANAIECDVYNFWQEVDCDECNTIFSCNTATTLTYTNPTGGTLPLSGASCGSFDCNDILTDIKYGYSTWLETLTYELGNSTLVNNMSFSVMNSTKDKPKGNQKVSNEPYVNDLFKKQNINNYGVSYFLPESLGVGFDIQKSVCNSDIIEIKKYNDDIYTLISEETDGTLGFYTYSADTNGICELTSFVDEQCCNRVSDYLDKTFKISKPNYGWVDGACRWEEVNSIEDNCNSDCSYYGTQVEETKFIFSGTSGVTLSSTCVDTPICIKPLDYLDKQPNEVNIKPNFDNMVLSNLIDVKSRQVISDYPLLRLFYNQYLNANGCGDIITNRLDYNTTFEVMDLIGDYWTDIIEQVVPATTIWDGCQNSGKVFRNTIFDQNKFPYKRYVLNYYNGDCEINEITRDAIAINTGSTIDLSEEVLTKDGDVVVVENSCDNIAEQLNEEEENLKNNYVVGTLSYSKKKAFVDTLRIRYESCKRKSNIDITQYNTMFISQTYDSNEYEGDVNVFGNTEWDSDTELLHACGSMEYICPVNGEYKFVKKTIIKNGVNITSTFIVFLDESDITNIECCQSLSGNLITDDDGDSYCKATDSIRLYE